MELFQPNDLSLAHPTFVPVDDVALRSEIRSALGHYKDGDRAEAIERFAGSSPITRNYRVRLPGRLLLLKSREGAFEERRLLREVALAEGLLAKGIPVPRLVRTNDHAPLVTQGETRWVAHVFEEGGYFGGTVEELRAAAEGFARLTRAANEDRRLDVPEVAESRFFSDLEPLLSMPWDGPDELLCREAPMILATLNAVRARRAEVESTVVLVHTDFHPLNFLVDAGRLQCILDMEDIEPYPLLAAVGFASYKLVRQMWIRPEIRAANASETVIGHWLDGWHAVLPERRYSVEELGLGARYRVLALIHLILDHARRGVSGFLYDLEKQVMSLHEIDVLYGPAATPQIHTAVSARSR